MSITLNPLFEGLDGNPPQTIKLSGTVSDAEPFEVKVDDNPEVDPVVDNGTWVAEAPNVMRKRCGTPIAVAILTAAGKESSGGPIVCPGCCRVFPSRVVGDCDNLTREVTLTLAFEAPLPAGATAQVRWSPGGGLAERTTERTGRPESVSERFSYPAETSGTYHPRAKVTITLQDGTECYHEEEFDFAPCEVVRCLPCPTVDLTSAEATGCAPLNARGALRAKLGPELDGYADLPPIRYSWMIKGPDGRQARREVSRTSLEPVEVDTASGWSGELTVGARPPLLDPSAVDLRYAGRYGCTVNVWLPGSEVEPGCTAQDLEDLIVAPCRCFGADSSAAEEWEVEGAARRHVGEPFRASACHQATLTIHFRADPGSYYAEDLVYRWNFGDSSLPVVQEGSAAQTQSHTFVNPTVGLDHTHRVTVTVSVPDSTCPPVERAIEIVVPGCCPQVEQVRASPTSACIDPGGRTRFEFSAVVMNPQAAVAGYRWNYGDGTPEETGAQNASHSYDRVGAFTVRAAPIIPAGGQCSESSRDTTITITRCRPDIQRPDISNTEMGWPCWLLLVAALLLGVAGTVLVLTSCPLLPGNAIAAGILGGVAIVLLIAWLMFCARGHCPVFNLVSWIVIAIMILTLLAAIGVGVAATWACSLIVTALALGFWGIVLAILAIFGRIIDCRMLRFPVWPGR